MTSNSTSSKVYMALLVDPIRDGWLLRQTKGFFGVKWVKNWYILKNSKLWIFESRDAYTQSKGMIDLRAFGGYIVEIVDDPDMLEKLGKNEATLFQLTHAAGKEPDIIFSAEDELDMESWVQLLLLEMFREFPISTVFVPSSPTTPSSPSISSTQPSLTSSSSTIAAETSTSTLTSVSNHAPVDDSTEKDRERARQERRKQRRIAEKALLEQEAKEKAAAAAAAASTTATATATAFASASASNKVSTTEPKTKTSPTTTTPEAATPTPEEQEALEEEVALEMDMLEEQATRQFNKNLVKARENGDFVSLAPADVSLREAAMEMEALEKAALEKASQAKAQREGFQLSLQNSKSEKERLG